MPAFVQGEANVVDVTAQATGIGTGEKVQDRESRFALRLRHGVAAVLGSSFVPAVPPAPCGAFERAALLASRRNSASFRVIWCS